MVYHFLASLTSQVEELSPSERRVAEFILKSPEEAMRLSLVKLAEVSAVSQPTVLRCLKRIGCNNLQDFRLKLAGAEAIGLHAAHASIVADSSAVDIAGLVLDYAISNLANLRNQIDGHKLKAVGDVLKEARMIHFWGSGASGIVAKDAQQKFPLFGVPCLAESDGHQILINASTLSANDAVVIISNTGRNATMVPAIREAKANGACVVAISSSNSNSIARSSDHVLLVPTLENTDIFTPTVSRLAALCIIDMLAIIVAQARDANSAQKIGNMKEVLVQTYRISGTEDNN